MPRILSCFLYLLLFEKGKLLQVKSIEEKLASFVFYKTILPIDSFKEIEQGPGIYIILCEPVNKIYVGQSINVSARLGTHWRTLMSNTHDCMLLQLDWNKYGQTLFKFICLTVGPQ